jgi:hypothetical protein
MFEKRDIAVASLHGPNSLGEFDLAVIPNFADEYGVDCAQVVVAMKAWRKARPLEGENLDRLCMQNSFVRRDVDPESSTTKHTFDSFFVNVSDPNDELGGITRNVFRALYEVDSTLNGPLRGTTHSIGNTHQSALRPQVIHYPSGGGFFDWHLHSRWPQGYGLILNLSQPTLDYESGSTCFRLEGQEVSTNDLHGYGALTLFRFDLPHMVEPIKPSADRPDWDRGRWSAVLPLLGTVDN